MPDREVAGAGRIDGGFDAVCGRGIRLSHNVYYDKLTRMPVTIDFPEGFACLEFRPNRALPHTQGHLAYIASYRPCRMVPVPEISFRFRILQLVPLI